MAGEHSPHSTRRTPSPNELAAYKALAPEIARYYVRLGDEVARSRRKLRALSVAALFLAAALGALLWLTSTTTQDVTPPMIAAMIATYAAVATTVVGLIRDTSRRAERRRELYEIMRIRQALIHSSSSPQTSLHLDVSGQFIEDPDSEDDDDTLEALRAMQASRMLISSRRLERNA